MRGENTLGACSLALAVRVCVCLRLLGGVRVLVLAACLAVCACLHAPCLAVRDPGLDESHIYPAETTSHVNINAGFPGFASAQCAAVAIAFRPAWQPIPTISTRCIVLGKRT